MQTITKSYDVYTFNELLPDAQKRVIEREREHRADDYPFFLTEDMKYKAEELLKAQGFKNITVENVYYSLACCQGDGAMVVFRADYKAWDVNVKHDNGHYYHWNSFSIESITSNKTGKDAPEAVEDEIKEKIIAVNKELERFGYDCIEYNESDESIREYLEDADGQYLEDGKPFID